MVKKGHNDAAKKEEKKKKRNKTEGMMTNKITKIKKKKKKNVGEMLKRTRFMLQRCSSIMKKNKEIKRKKSFLGISIDDVISYVEEADVLLSQMEEKADEPQLEDDLNKIIRVEEGERIDIIPLLFPKHRNYLLKSHSNRLVKAEDLQGKLIALCFANLYDSIWDIPYFFSLIDVYNEIHHKAPFEVVFVPLTLPSDHKKYPHVDPHDAFDQIFSSMPWTTVPYSDAISWQRLQATFGFKGTIVPDIPVVDPTCLILAVNGHSLFSSFGARGFPYSEQRIRFLEAEAHALLKHPSIYNLVASSEREYVVSNDGRQDKKKELKCDPGSGSKAAGKWKMFYS